VYSGSAAMAVPTKESKLINMLARMIILHANDNASHFDLQAKSPYSLE
jgi:hypothetical protein